MVPGQPEVVVAPALVVSVPLDEVLRLSDGDDGRVEPCHVNLAVFFFADGHLHTWEVSCSLEDATSVVTLPVEHVVDIDTGLGNSAEFAVPLAGQFLWPSHGFCLPL